MYGYLYITTNLINNKRYIGQRRGEFCPNYFGSGHGINNAIKHYGVRWFRVDPVKSFESRKELDSAEIRLIKNYREAYGRDALYNQSNGGTGGDNLKNNPNREEIYKRISKKLTGRKTGYSFWTGKQHTKESNVKRSNGMKKAIIEGRKTFSNREVLMSMNKGNKFGCFKRSEETKNKLRAWRIGTKLINGKYVKLEV